LASTNCFFGLQAQALSVIHTNFFLNFGIDLATILIFTGAFFYQRHKRRDLFVTFTFFNIAMFVIVTLIADTPLGLGASFGLFALLALIRLRSEEFSNYEIGYFFGCLTLAIVNGSGSENYLLTVALNTIILLSIGILDHPRIMQSVQHATVSLDAVYTDDAKTTAALENLLNAEVLGFSITSIDNVHDVTTMSVEYKKNGSY